MPSLCEPGIIFMAPFSTLTGTSGVQQLIITSGPKAFWRSSAGAVAGILMYTVSYITKLEVNENIILDRYYSLLSK